MAYNEVLSQDEVDALLNDVARDSKDAAPPAQPSDATPAYDLGSQARVVRGRMHTLELINDRFARNLRSGLLNFIRRVPDINPPVLGAQQYGEFIKHLPVPANINLLQMKPLRGTGLIVFDPKLVFLVVDHLFGSDGRYHMRIEGRDFTATEQRIIAMLRDVVLTCYGDAWKPVMPLEFNFLRAEMSGKLANIVSADEVVVTTTLQIEFGPVGGFLHVCIPYSMLEPVRSLLSNRIQGGEIEVDNRWVSQMSREIRSAEVELRAEFVQMESTVGELLKLKKGDILPFELPTAVTARVEHTPVMECRFGLSGGHYALHIEKMLALSLEDGNNHG